MATRTLTVSSPSGCVGLTPAVRCVGASMDGATLSPYPHYSWLAHWIAIRPPRVFASFEARHVSHRLLLTTGGESRIAWTAHGTSALFRSTIGDIGFYPCDSAPHGLTFTATDAYQAYAILLPANHVCAIGASDDLHPEFMPRAVPVFRDTVLQACLLRLSEGSGCRDVSEDIGDEIAARQIVMRLCALAGGSPPDWLKDTSVFAPCVMRQIVERVDTLLAAHASLEHISRGFGLSPSHFARKFQQSAGLSLNRFMNRRRIGLALVSLRKAQVPLAQLSIDLGFCSQSHFTRVFSGLTGMTPYQFSRARHLG